MFSTKPYLKPFKVGGEKHSEGVSSCGKRVRDLLNPLMNKQLSVSLSAAAAAAADADANANLRSKEAKEEEESGRQFAI